MSTSNAIRSAKRPALMTGLALLLLLVLGQGTALAGFSVSKLRLGGSAGLENYLYTAGDTVWAEGTVDAGKYYRFVVTDPAGTERASSACAPTAAGGKRGNGYAIKATDPASGSNAWRYQLKQFSGAGCTGSVSTKQLYFDVVTASVYADSALTVPRSSYQAGASAYLKLFGVGKVKGSQANTSVSDWATTWMLPSGLTACANTGGGDRPDSTSAGVLPASSLGTSPYLQYRPNTLAGPDSTPWNLESNYETRPCPALGAANEGLWRLKLKRDNTHFVTLPAFSVDTTAPNTTVGGGPAGPTSATSASFDLQSSEAGSSFECRLDAGAWTACSSPNEYSGLGDGSHTVEVRAVDAAGNVDPSPASQSWTVDSTLPAVSLAAPADDSATNDATPSFSGGAGTAAGDSMTVSVKVYSGDTPSGSPVQELTAARAGGSWSVDASAPLADGVYTAFAEQADAADNNGFSEAHTFTVDTVAPNVSLIEPAAGGSTSDTLPTFAGAAGSADGDGDTVTVKLYSGSSASGAPLQTLSATRSGGAWSVPPDTELSEGAYTAVASQSDAAGNTRTSSAHTFSVDTTAPSTAIIAGPGAATSSTYASFHFNSSEPGSSFQCRLDGSAWGACTSPKSYSGLSEGSHTFEVRATDRAGNVDPDPESATWSVNLSLPTVSLGSPADGSATNDTTPAFSGSAGTAAGDSENVSLKIYKVEGGSDVLVQTRTAVRSSGDGSWSTTASPALEDGLYVVHAEQDGSAGTGYSASRSFSVDTVAPSTSLGVAPPSATASTDASFSLSSSEAGSSFECRLDGGDWAACSSPKAYSGLGAGAHTFQVRAIDAAGNADATPASHTWTVDLSLPAVTMTTPADGSSTNDLTPAFGGSASIASGDDGTVTVKIYRQVAGGPDELVQTRSAVRSSSDGSWSLHAFPALDEGSYVAHAEQAGTGGTGSSASRTFTVDVTAPRTSIGLAPSGTTTSTDARFSFSSSEPGSSFECRLDGGAWEACSSPKAYSGLSSDSHSFEVRAIDAAGNADPTAANTSWTVDTSAPAVTLTSPADDSSINDATPQFSGSASTAAGDSDTITVELYEGGSMAGEPLETLTTTRSSVDGSWSVSASPALEEGTYHAIAKQEDSAANESYSSARTFTVDVTAPDVGLAQPAANSVLTDSTPQLSGTAGTAGGDSDTVVVRLYSGTSASGSPVQSLNANRSGNSWAVDAASLADGTYTAQARQADSAGNTGASSARTFKVDSTAPVTSIDAGPSGTVLSSNASFEFSASEAGSSFECKLDSSAWAACSSPKAYSGLPEGSHTMRVRATDAVGNLEATPATRTWTVAAPPAGSGSSGDAGTTAGLQSGTPVTKLGLRLARLKRQRRLARGKLQLYARCSANCTMRAPATASVKPLARNAKARRIKLGKVAVKLAAGKRKLVTVKLSRKVRSKLLAALGRREKVTVTISARATGAPGAVRAKLVFRLKR